MTRTIQLHKAQAGFRYSDALYRGFVGGRGAGKSWIGDYDLLRRAKPKRLYGMYAPTYRMLQDATLRTFLEIGETLMFIKAFNRSDLRVTLGNGAEVICRSLEDPERARGPNLSGAFMDEASLVKRAAFDIIIASLREEGEQGWLSAAFTPKGRSHWTYDVFGNEKSNGAGKGVALFHARTLDNPFLPDTFYESVRSQYTSRFAEQELEGIFMDIVGNLAQREWFAIVDAVPAKGQRCRHWDFAATVKAAAGDDPDWTVGTLMAVEGGIYYVENVVRARLGPGAVEALVKQTAQLDGRGVKITLEQEPGASGKLAAWAMVKALSGWNVRARPVTGDKVTRAMPFLAQAEAGNVKLKRAAWNADWLDEICAMPEGAHDDQWDSASGAFNELGSRRSRKVVTW